jgi:hypothetical protein
MNVMEHIFETQFVFAEQVRTVKRGGLLVYTTPFMHHIHASPDDYHRYTASAYERLVKNYGCTIVECRALGKGIFSMIYQYVGGAIPFNFFRTVFMKLSILLDSLFYKISKRYRRFASTIPLGYFVVMKKD